VSVSGQSSLGDESGLAIRSDGQVGI
jgi:hypothetical protein